MANKNWGIGSLVKNENAFSFSPRCRFPNLRSESFPRSRNRNTPERESRRHGGAECLGANSAEFDTVPFGSISVSVRGRGFARESRARRRSRELWAPAPEKFLLKFFGPPFESSRRTRQEKDAREERLFLCLCAGEDSNLQALAGATTSR